MSATVVRAWSPAAWPYVSLSSRKLSMSMRATPTAACVDAGALDGGRDQVDQRPVVERPVSVSWSSASTSARVWRVMRALRRAEDEVQDDGRDQAGRQRHQREVATDALEGREDRRGVAPDADDRRGPRRR